MDREQRKRKAREYHQANRSKIKGQRKVQAERNPLARLVWLARHRAKKRQIEFSISVDDLSLPSCCPVLGIPLRVGRSNKDPNAYSLDRIDNSKGYIKGNVAVISLRANFLKNDGTPEEIVALAKWLSSLLGDCHGTPQPSPSPASPQVRSAAEVD